MHQAIEAYYPPKIVAALLHYSEKWVIQKTEAGDFGAGCFYVAGDYRIPASGVNSFIEKHAVPKTQAQQFQPIKARTQGELRRKIEESKRLDGA